MDGQVHSRSYRTIQDRFWGSEIQPRLVICTDDMEGRAAEIGKCFVFSEQTTEWRGIIDHPDEEVVNVMSPITCTSG